MYLATLLAIPAIVTPEKSNHPEKKPQKFPPQKVPFYITCQYNFYPNGKSHQKRNSGVIVKTV